LTKFAEELKKENVFHKNQGLINSIHEVLERSENLKEENEVLKKEGIRQAALISALSESELANKVEDLEEELERYRNVLQMYEPWSLPEILKKLIESADILLHDKNYDGLGWEEHEYAFRKGKELLKTLTEPKNHGKPE